MPQPQISRCCDCRWTWSPGSNRCSWSSFLLLNLLATCGQSLAYTSIGAVGPNSHLIPSNSCCCCYCCCCCSSMNSITNMLLSTLLSWSPSVLSLPVKATMLQSSIGSFVAYSWAPLPPPVWVTDVALI